MPWSRGGGVGRIAVREPNSSAWRRAVSCDLTGPFDFDRRNLTLPLLPDTSMLRKLADQT
jgi:phospholipase C